MPELPEVETIVRCLRPHLVGLEIEAVRVFFPPLIRNEDKSVLGELEGARVCGLRRRGKMILLDCHNGFSLLFHLKMTGQLLFSSTETPLDKHVRLIISFQASAQELRFRDVRKFGFVRLLRTEEIMEAPEIRLVGPEPINLDWPSFLRCIQGRRGRLKSLLINQRIIAGIGNIYGDEILFQARLHPADDLSRLQPTDLKRLRKMIPFILQKAISGRGTSIRDFRDGDGLEGGYQSHLRVYGRESEPCFRCGAKIRRLRLSGRSSFFCPRCQKKKMPLRRFDRNSRLV